MNLMNLMNLMNTLNTRRTAGILLVVVPLLFSVCFTLLQQLFEYPDILRQPTHDIMTKFVGGGRSLIAVWYLLTLSAVAFVPLAILMHRVLAEREGSTLLWIGTALGVVAGVSQTLGFLRWPFLVPYLARTYLDPAASEAQRVAASTVFEAFHRFGGMAVGEHLGYLSTSVWTLLISVVVLQTGALPRWVGVIGLVLALGIAAGLSEPAGWAIGGTINAIAYLAWAAWLVTIGVTLLARGVPARDRARVPLAEAAV